ncbi:hypothetical protein B4O97_18815 [Marispirochaeta aestuarii]|uniref:3-keto-disaccharide hydrolase domain-containing protein n=1 Tax=Marispirochaeta aestuarii TaxID=1963862 RepID=A0A1Y1RT05_9SPIO|nr:hypothetical protein [Marispirochaeta aestuarii]ORC29883.1 hypothetical protein B4O97_18815 [Marispirochaeta aestuarii]
MADVKGWCIFIAFAVLFSGCQFIDTSKPTGWDGNLGGDGVQVDSTLFSEDETAGEIIFETNDEQYSDPYGSSFWYPVENSDQQPFTEWTVSAAKSSGNRNAGFGIVFCHSVDEDSGEERMLSVMIRTDRYYQIASIIGTEYAPNTSWTQSSAIYGTGLFNELRVQRASDGIFTLYINDQEITDFEYSGFSGGSQGYLVVVSPLEDFPDVPVNVSFKTE